MTGKEFESTPMDNSPPFGRKWWDAPKNRSLLYAGVAVVLYFLAIGLVSLKPQFDFAVSDGRYYYAYLPSCIIDQDLDFRNQIKEHWGPDFRPELLELRTQLGHVQNKYPIGLALSLAPTFLLAHETTLVSRALGFENPLDGYSMLYQIFNLAAVFIFVWAALSIMDRLLVNRFGFAPRRVGLALLVLWAATPLGYYTFREPFMVHAVSMFWVTATIAASLSGLKRASAFLLLTFCFSMAIVCRPTNVVLMAPFLFVAIRRTLTDRQLLNLSEASTALCSFVAVAVGAAPLYLQAWIWKQMHGEFIHYSYESEGFNFLSPALVETLISSKHGLFFWSPILLLASWGIISAMRSAGPGRTFAIQAGTGLVLLWWVNSSWHEWWFGDAFGARSFVEASPLFAFGLVSLFSMPFAARRTPRRWLVAGIGLCLLQTLLLLVLYISHRIPRGDYLF